MCTHVHTHTKTEDQAQVPPTSPCSYRSFSLYSDFFHQHQQVPVNSSMQNLKAFYYMSQYRFECNKDYNYWAFMRSNIFPLVHASSAVHKQAWILILRLLPASPVPPPRQKWRSSEQAQDSLHCSPSVTPGDQCESGRGFGIKVAIFWCGLNIRPQCKEVWKAQPSTRDWAS